MSIEKIVRGRAVLLIIGTLSLFLAGDFRFGTVQPGMGHGDLDTLKSAFEGWRAADGGKSGSPEVLKLGLGYSWALSRRFTEARGKLEFKLVDGWLRFRAEGLDAGEYVLWFGDDGPGAGNAVTAQAAGRWLRIGGLRADRGKAVLETRLTAGQLAGFTLDTVALAEAGKSPPEGTVITGAVDLLQKLYYADQPWAAVDLGGFRRRVERAPAPYEVLLPRVAQADAVSDLAAVLGPLVAEGRRLFHEETFAGNGRTCGTCHREDNNFTLDPNYIMRLPPGDPLFVAETRPALAGLENPVLMRKYGLMLTPIDGPGIEVFRGVPHTLSLATTIRGETKAAGGEFEADQQFVHATGWSGDGAPGSGSLREFTLGAVAQHLPRTLNRVPGVDFRVPTAGELDAIEAYLLSLGRGKDYPLYQLSFSDPLTEAGKRLFDTKQNPCTHGTEQTGNPAVCPDGETVVLGQTANCNGCHQNAGGRSSTTQGNPTRDTGVERLNIHPARLVEPDLARDGGFGRNASACGPNRDQPCQGDGRFNTPPLVEAADTAPYFHNNAVSTLEEAIAFYNNDAFNTSPGALTAKLADRRVKLDSTQVVAVASFLRALNALENLRLSDRLDDQARRVENGATARKLARLGWQENQDAIQVLKEGVLGNYWRATRKLERAARYQRLAQGMPARTVRNFLLRRAASQKREARALIARCDPDAPVPSTVSVPPAGSLYTCAELGL